MCLFRYNIVEPFGGFFMNGLNKPESKEAFNSYHVSTQSAEKGALTKCAHPNIEVYVEEMQPLVRRHYDNPNSVFIVNLLKGYEFMPIPLLFDESAKFKFIIVSLSERHLQSVGRAFKGEAFKTSTKCEKSTIYTLSNFAFIKWPTEESGKQSAATSDSSSSSTPQILYQALSTSTP